MARLTLTHYKSNFIDCFWHNRKWPKNNKLKWREFGKIITCCFSFYIYFSRLFETLRTRPGGEVRISVTTEPPQLRGAPPTICQTTTKWSTLVNFISPDLGSCPKRSWWWSPSGSSSPRRSNNFGKQSKLLNKFQTLNGWKFYKSYVRIFPSLVVPSKLQRKRRTGYCLICM